MSNIYQSKPIEATHAPGVPAQVLVSLGEIAESAKEGLLALAVGTGMQVMAAMFGEDVTRLCGPDGKHNPARAGYRHGTGAGSVTLGGRRVPVTRPGLPGPALAAAPRPKAPLHADKASSF